MSFGTDTLLFAEDKQLLLPTIASSRANDDRSFDRFIV